MSAESAPPGALWRRVDALLDEAGDDPGALAGLRAHGVHLLAAARWRAQGRPIPDSLLRDERDAIVLTAVVPGLLSRISAIVEQPAVILKGPVIAARYPDPTR